MKPSGALGTGLKQVVSGMCINLTSNFFSQRREDAENAEFISEYLSFFLEIFVVAHGFLVNNVRYHITALRLCVSARYIFNNYLKRFV